MLSCSHANPMGANPWTFTSTMKYIKAESGLKGIFLPGLNATLFREVFYSSVRFGLYTNIKNYLLETKIFLSDLFKVACFSGENDIQLNFFDKLLAGMITGAFGSAIANPTDLVKIRLQNEYGLVCSTTGLYLNGPKKGQLPTYRNTLDAFRQIARHEGYGMNGWMKGVYATMARAALITGGQLASYESAKTFWKKNHGFEEGPGLHTLCSIWSGLVAATFCAPADIVKTRLMCSSGGITGSVPYQGAWECFKDILRREGAIGLFRGWLPSYLRLAPHFIISLPLNEQFRKLFGLSTI